MAWNGSSDIGGATARASAKNRTRARRPSPWRGVVAGVSVVALVLVAMVLVMRRNGGKAGEDSSRGKEMIEAVKPQPPRETKPRAVSPGPRDRDVDLVLSSIPEKPKTEIKVRQISPEEWERLTNRVFKTGTDQLISWVCQVTPGDMPMPIPPLSDEEKKNMLAILMSKIPSNEKDDERLSTLKEDVNFAKKEMASYIAEGGDPDEFLQYYFKELKRAFDYRNEIISQVNQIYEDGDRELAREFRKRANAILAERGIRTVPLSDFEEDNEMPEEEREDQ